jgi:hypothetical protein
MRLTIIDLGDIYNGIIEHGKVSKVPIPMKENQTLAAFNYIIREKLEVFLCLVNLLRNGCFPLRGII